MSWIIALSNQMVGVGKTTTAINLSACLAEKGKKVLVIDMDPQGNTTSGLGVDKENVEHTSYELLLETVTVKETITKSVMETLDVIPSERGLAGAEIEIVGKDNREFVLKNQLEKVKDNYDFIIIDCPPSLKILTVNEMTTANTVIVHIQWEYFA